MQHFILDAQRRVVQSDLLAWGRWVGTAGSLEIARTELTHLLVLTAFAGIDISFGDGAPAFFETRVLDGIDELACVDSSSWDEALAAHQALVGRWSGWSDAAQGAAKRVLAAG